MKIRKHLFGVMLLSALLILCLGGAAQSSAAFDSPSISAERAVEIAWADMRSNSGLTAEEMADFRCQLQELQDLTGDTRYWMIVLVSDLTSAEYWVQVDSSTGDVFQTERAGYAEGYREFRQMAVTEAIAERARAKMEKEMGPYVFWPYQEKAAFYARYPGSERRHLPDAEDMSEEEAVRLAREEMAKVLLADDAYLDGFGLDTGFNADFYVGADPQPSWFITYRAKEPTADGAYPQRHMAIVDARDGEIILAIHINEGGQLVTGDGYRDTMYYNPEGGKYFHHDAQCRAVHASFLPLRAYARGDVIHDDALLSLMPCVWCVFGDNGDWGTDWIRG